MKKEVSVTREPWFPNQIVPLVLTAAVFLAGIALLYGEILVMNFFGGDDKTISTQIHWGDVLVGMVIYLKTAIDFAIFIGRLMHEYPGWKNRVMIEIGTALGNIFGTLVIILLWNLFREIDILLGLMVVIASLVLLRMAEEGLEHVKDEEGKYKINFGGLELVLENILRRFNRLVAPVLNKIIPKIEIKQNKQLTFFGLIALSFTVPFILGLDDFAGYVPLFNIVNIFGFAIGVFAGHMILNIALFLSPKTTTRLVKHPVISFVGSLAFIGLAVWGLYEASHIFIKIFAH